jgi:hypothetical protein
MQRGVGVPFVIRNELEGHSHDVETALPEKQGCDRRIHPAAHRDQDAAGGA